MPRRQLNTVAKDRYHALKRLGCLCADSPEEFDRMTQYRTAHVRAGREDAMRMLYSMAIEATLVEAYAMMVEATDIDQELWGPKLAEMETVMNPGPSSSRDVMEQVESRYVPEARPSKYTQKRHIFKDAQIKYLQEQEKSGQMELDLGDP